MRSTKLAVLFAVALAKPTVAQDRAVQFRVGPVPGNPSGCTSLDATLSGVHTIALMRDRAALKSTGGIKDTLKQSAPGWRAPSSSRRCASIRDWSSRYRAPEPW